MALLCHRPRGPASRPTRLLQTLPEPSGKMPGSQCSPLTVIQGSTPRPPPPPPLPQSRVYVTLMARPRQRVKGSGKVFSHRSPSMHPLLILSTFSTLILRGLLCFPWVLRSKDPMWILYGVRLRAREKSCLLSTYYIHHLANK